MLMPRSVIPQPDPGRVPGPHSSHQPATSRKNGSNQRIVPNHGAKTPVHHLVRAPSPDSISAMNVIAPRTSRVSPMIERTTSGVIRAPQALDVERAREARVGVVRAVERRRVATSDLDDDRED